MTTLKPLDEMSLKKKLHRSRRRRALVSFTLLAPLVIFDLVVFVMPIGSMFLRSVDNHEIVAALPRTAEALREWRAREIPEESAYGALAADLKAAEDTAVIGRLAKRLNYELPGFRSLILSTRRYVGSLAEGPYKETLINFDGRWGQLPFWIVIRRNLPVYTDFYFLSAIDRRRDMEGRISWVPPNEAIFLTIFARTLWVSGILTLMCLFLGYPVAYLLATVRPRTGNLLMFVVLLPFWTSLMVRTTAWIILLQREGLINRGLKLLGIIATPLDLVFNRAGMLIALVYVLLPYMVLPVYSVMKGIDPQHLRAAQSLGAGPARSFFRVYLPQTLPGISAGCVLVFILMLGYYVTPELVGGPKDQMISSFIAYYTNVALNWGLASALAAILMVSVVMLYFIYQRVVGFDALRGESG